MYYAMRASAPSLHRESTDSLIKMHVSCIHGIIMFSHSYLILDMSHWLKLP